MRNKTGFTLTEVLLAVMIVAVIGVALASLTTAASRESGIGGSRVLLRNNVALALRQIREDLNSSSRVIYVAGNLSNSSATRPLLVLSFNKDRSGEDILEDSLLIQGSKKGYVSYCFARGTTAALPEGSYSGGTITRHVYDTAPTSATNSCPSNSVENVLTDVKYVNGYDFHSPSVYALDRASGILTAFTGNSTTGVIRLQLVVELPGSNPVVNDAVEEIFVLPSGVNRIND